MSDSWGEYWRFHREWSAAKDAERLRLFDLYLDACAWRETEPERMQATLLRGRDESQRLGEPWWIDFFDVWRLSTLTYDLGDMHRARPFAMEVMARMNTPTLRQHPFRPYLLLAVLAIYTAVDPGGHQDEIERGYVHLETEISSDPVGDRHVMHSQRMIFLESLDRYEEAHALGQRALAFVDQSRDVRTRVWHSAWTSYRLCRICSELGHLDRIAPHAQHMLSITKRHDNLRRVEADAHCWLAVVARSNGNEREASRELHQGLALLPDLAGRDTSCADSIAKHHELGEEWDAALAVRMRQRIYAETRGLLNGICELDLERCRLLAKISRLTQADRDAALRSFARLRSPERFAAKLARIENAT